MSRTDPFLDLAETQLGVISDRVNQYEPSTKTYGQAAKTAAILAGAVGGTTKAGPSFLQYVADRRQGDPEANEYVKSILGTSAATGQAVVPNNFVAQITAQVATLSPWRNVINFVETNATAAVDIPYELTAITAALVQGAYGSNKDVRDFSFGEATATLYTIAQIADVGNQLLRQSGGAAESIVRRRLAASFAITEDVFITTGTGTNQPLGFLPAFLAFGDPAAFKTTLSSEPRLATIGRALGALEGRGQVASAVIMNPTDFWEMATEGLGTSYAGGWAADPVGAANSAPSIRVWGVPVYRSASLTVGTALAGNFAAMDAYVGGQMRIDVSSEAGTRFDQNITGFRAEEEFGFTAEPYVRTGMVQKILGL